MKEFVWVEVTDSLYWSSTSKINMTSWQVTLPVRVPMLIIPPVEIPRHQVSPSQVGKMENEKPLNEYWLIHTEDESEEAIKQACTLNPQGYQHHHTLHCPSFVQQWKQE